MATVENNNAKVIATSVKQAANEVLGTNEKTLYYLIISNGEEKTVINVGEKTHNEVLRVVGGTKKK